VARERPIELDDERAERARLSLRSRLDGLEQLLQLQEDVVELGGDPGPVDVQHRSVRQGPARGVDRRELHVAVGDDRDRDDLRRRVDRDRVVVRDLHVDPDPRADRLDVRNLPDGDAEHGHVGVLEEADGLREVRRELVGLVVLVEPARGDVPADCEQDRDDDRQRLHELPHGVVHSSVSQTSETTRTHEKMSAHLPCRVMLPK
jgi:hypothetical protein